MMAIEQAKKWFLLCFYDNLTSNITTENRQLLSLGVQHTHCSTGKQQSNLLPVTIESVFKSPAYHHSVFKILYLLLLIFKLSCVAVL
jgi:hypothetical protein